MMKKHKFTSNIMLGLMLMFFYGPIITLMVFSFNDSRSLVNWSGFSTRWYTELFESRDTLEALQTSVSIAIIATIVSVVVGTVSAIALSKQKKIFKRIFMSINNLPVLNPEIVTAVSMMLLFSSLKVNKGYMTMLIAHITFCIPYVILTILPKLRSLDSSLADAAMDLGATPTQALTKVILPQLTPAIISSALLAFTMSFDDFVISYFVAGDTVSNISIRVYTMAKRVNPTINALSTIIIVIITIGLILINVIPLLNKKKQKGKMVKG